LEKVRWSLPTLFESGEHPQSSHELSEVKQRFSFGLLHDESPVVQSGFLPHRHHGAVHEKQQPFVAGRGECQSAPSRAPGGGIHGSGAEAVDGRRGRIGRSVRPGRASSWEMGWLSGGVQRRVTRWQRQYPSCRLFATDFETSNSPPEPWPVRQRRAKRARRSALPA